MPAITFQLYCEDVNETWLATHAVVLICVAMVLSNRLIAWIFVHFGHKLAV